MTLLHALVALVAIAAAVAGASSAQSAFARAGTQRVDAGLAASALARATATMLDDVSQAIAAGAPSRGTLPAVGSDDTGCLDDTLPCDYTLSESVRLTAGAIADAPCATGGGCAQNLESNPHVQEGRLGGTMLATIHRRDGSVALQRRYDVVLRTFAAPPYVTIASVRDASADAGPTAANEGDTGGIAPATFVRAAYLNTQTGSLTDASTFESQAWANGNARTSGWRP